MRLPTRSWSIWPKAMRLLTESWSVWPMAMRLLTGSLSVWPMAMRLPTGSVGSWPMAMRLPTDLFADFPPFGAFLSAAGGLSADRGGFRRPGGGSPRIGVFQVAAGGLSADRGVLGDQARIFPRRQGARRGGGRAPARARRLQRRLREDRRLARGHLPRRRPPGAAAREPNADVGPAGDHRQPDEPSSRPPAVAAIRKTA